MKNTVQISLKETIKLVKAVTLKSKLTLLLLAIASVGFSQVNGQFLIGGPAKDGSSNAIQLADGDYLYVSTTESYGAGGSDLLVIRFKPDFSIRWKKTFGRTGDELIYDRGCLLENTDGSLMVLATTTSYGVGDADAMLFKMNAAGVVIWKKTYGGAEKERTGVIRHAPAGGYIIGGSTDSYNTLNAPAERNLSLMRVDNGGNVLWQKAYGRDEDHYVSSVQIADILPLSTGEFLMAGTFQGSNSNSASSFISKVDAAGTIVWFNTYVIGSSSGWEIIGGLTLKDATTALAVGATKHHTSEGPSDALILSLNISNGNVNWSKTYDAPNTNTSEWLYSIKKENNNRYIVNMYENSAAGLGSYDVGLLAIDASGNTLGQAKAFGTAQSEHSKWFAPTLDGGYILSGVSGSGNGADGYVVKVDNNWNSGCNEQNIALTATSITITPTSYTPEMISYDQSFTIPPNQLWSIDITDDVLIPLCCYIETSLAVTPDDCSNNGSYTVTLDDVLNSPATGSSYTTSTGQSGSISQGQSVTISNLAAGNYTFTIMSGASGCDKTIDVTIDEGVCCPAATDPQYVHIATDPAYQSNQIWSGKYYIADGVTVTVSNGAVLDITNVDVVFGECAGIVFENGAYLRSNNSVFRPCDAGGTWKGILLEGKGGQSVFDNSINESTFKNAEVALFFKDGADGVVSNNLFSNCNIGIRVANNSMFNHPISGNSFVTEGSYPVYGNCYGFTDMNTAYGISVQESKLNEVSQNSFINALRSDMLTVYGIHQKNAGGIVSKNTFTNMNTAIVVNAPIYSTILENNEIEINRAIASMSSIAVFGSVGANIEIANNQLNNNYHTNGSGNAIYAEHSSQISVLSNQISGYNTGVYMYQCGASQVAYNLLTNINNIGIYYHQMIKDSYNMYITCNDITMTSFSNTVGIIAEKMNRVLQITSNCVKDAEEAIKLLGDKGVGIPYVRNNYLYNYSGYGIFNNNHTGHIGTAGDPGMNTLWSNHSNTIDVYSTTPLTIANNFGVSSISSSIDITDKEPMYSTASCGHQIFGVESQENLNTNLLCDNIGKVVQPLQKQGAKFVLQNNFLSTLSTQESQLSKANMILSSVDNPSEILLNNIVATTDLSANESNWLKYYFYYRAADMNKARLFLNAIVPSTTKEESYKKLSALELDMVANNYQLTNADTEMLQDIAFSTDKSEQSNFAAYLLKQTASHPVYRYSEYELTNVATDLDIINIDGVESYLNVYPSPSSSMVYVELFNQSEGGKIQLFDVAGKIVENYNLSIVAGRVEIDISGLSNGLYFITLTDAETGFVQQGKIVKANN